MSLQVSNHYIAAQAAERERERGGGRVTACLQTFELNLNCLSLYLTLYTINLYAYFFK